LNNQLCRGHFKST